MLHMRHMFSIFIACLVNTQTIIMYCYDRSVGAVTESVHGNVICNVTSSTTYILLQSVGGENHYRNLERTGK